MIMEARIKFLNENGGGAGGEKKEEEEEEDLIDKEGSSYQVS